MLFKNIDVGRGLGLGIILNKTFRLQNVLMCEKTGGNIRERDTN